MTDDDGIEIIRRHGRTIRVRRMSMPNSRTPEARARRLGEDRYSQVPLKWAAECAKTLRCPRAFIFVWLQYLSWLHNNMTFPVPNGDLKQFGIDRFTKHRTLKKLEAAGKLSILREGKKAVRVTLHFEGKPDNGL